MRGTVSWRLGEETAGLAGSETPSEVSHGVCVLLSFENVCSDGADSFLCRRTATLSIPAMPSIEDLEQLYKSPIDFDALADAYPPLRAQSVFSLYLYDEPHLSIQPLHKVYLAPLMATILSISAIPKPKGTANGSSVPLPYRSASRADL